MNSKQTKRSGDKLNSKAMAHHRKRFLRFFPKGFYDQRYIDWEHTYKWETHKLFNETLDKEQFAALLRSRDYEILAKRALAVESKCKPPFLFSFEKMALRDALKTPSGARTFSEALFNLLYGKDELRARFIEWIMAVSELPRKQSRVLSWPILTFYPYIAQPKRHMIMKPTAMRTAAFELGFDLEYSSKPSFAVYERLLLFGELTREAIIDLKPRNNFDVQTFLWVIGSAEYEHLEQQI